MPHMEGEAHKPKSGSPCPVMPAGGKRGLAQVFNSCLAAADVNSFICKTCPDLTVCRRL